MSSKRQEHEALSRTSSPTRTQGCRRAVGRWWSEAVRARIRIIRAIPSAGLALALALLVTNVVLGLLPVAFIVSTLR